MKLPAMPLILTLAGLLSSASAFAEPDAGDTIRKVLGELLPESPVQSVRPTPVAGLSEVQIDSRIIYMSNDGKYMMQGNLIDVANRVDLSEERRKQIRLSAIDGLGEDKMIVFPADDPRHEVTVFTDIDCTYCRKLHREIDQYNARGITVRYVMYPRSGIDTPSYEKAVAVWCEKDRQDAMTRAKAGEELTGSRDCKNPVNEHIELGKTMGLRGTPAIVIDDGEMLPGYVPADKLAFKLDTNL